MTEHEEKINNNYLKIVGTTPYYYHEGTLVNLVDYADNTICGNIIVRRRAEWNNPFVEHFYEEIKNLSLSGDTPTVIRGYIDKKTDKVYTMNGTFSNIKIP